MRGEQEIICFVGADMTGKTEISKQLSYLLNIPYFKAKDEHQNVLNKQENFVNHLLYSDPRQIDLLKQVGFSMIMDRGWPCEYAYSRFFKRSSPLENIIQNDARYAELNAKIIFCFNPTFEGIQDDLMPELKQKELLQIQAYYQDFLCNITKCKYMLLNTSEQNLNKQCFDIINWLATV